MEMFIGSKDRQKVKVYTVQELLKMKMKILSAKLEQ